MNLSLYLDKKTWVHRLDGRTKVLSLLALFTMTLIFSDPRYLLAVTVLVVGGVLAAQSLFNLRKLQNVNRLKLRPLSSGKVDS